jgi:heme exporter protein CcmD
MTDLHGSFIAAAYGLSALVLAVEWFMLRRRRRQALERAAREHDFDDTTVTSD